MSFLTLNIRVYAATYPDMTSVCNTDITVQWESRTRHESAVTKANKQQKKVPQNPSIASWHTLHCFQLFSRAFPRRSLQRGEISDLVQFDDRLRTRRANTGERT